jgi:hypothetical protein
MFTGRIPVTAWVRLDGTAGIEYDVSEDQVELCFGGPRGNFQILATEGGLQELVTKSSEALRRIRAGEIDD